MYRNNEPIDSAKKHGFVIHRPFGLPSYVKEIPDFELSRPFPLDINEDGVLLGDTFDSVQNAHGLYVFDTLGTDASLLPTALPVVTFASGGINNAMPPQVFGRRSDLKPFIYTLGSPSPQILNFERIDAMNDMGAFCGPVTQRKSAIAYRYQSGVYQTFADAKSGATEINENGDMIFGSGRVGSEVQLYSEGRGTLNLGSLVVGNATEVSLFRNYTVSVRGLTERGSLNPFMFAFPGVGGMISGPNGLVPFTLTPVAP